MVKSFQNLPICRIIFCSLPHKAILTKHTEQFRNAGMSIFSCLQEKITCDRSVELVYLRILGEENNFFLFCEPFLVRVHTTVLYAFSNLSTLFM